MKTVTTHLQTKIADFKMTKEQIKVWADENKVRLSSFSYLTKNKDGSFEREDLGSDLNVFHFENGIDTFYEKMFEKMRRNIL